MISIRLLIPKRNILTIDSTYLIIPLLTISFFSFTILSVIDIANAATDYTFKESIPVGANPQKLEFNSNNGHVYTSGSFSDSILYVLDISTNTVIDTVQITYNTFPYGIAFNPSNGNMYVAQQGSHFPSGIFTVSVIDSTTNTVIKEIPVGGIPFEVAYNPSNGNIYVTNIGGDTVSVIDSSTSTVIDTIGVNEPAGIAYNPSNGNMYVTQRNFASTTGTVSVIDSSTNTVIDIIPVGDLPEDGIAYNPSNGNMYVANIRSNTVSVINSTTNTEITEIPVGQFPDEIAFNSADNNMYVSNLNSATISVIDSSRNTVIDTIPLTVPNEILFHPINHNMYVANNYKGTVDVFNFSSSPQNTPGKITAGGAQIGKDTNFAFNVMSNDGITIKGQLQYNYKDINNKINLQSKKITSLIISPDKTQGEFSGTGTINGNIPATFTVNVVDNGEPGNKDKFSIIIKEINYTSSGTLTKGNIQIH